MAGAPLPSVTMPGCGGGGSGKTRAEAERNALEGCGKRTTGCYVALAVPADGSQR